jgi:hypothetical protein
MKELKTWSYSSLNDFKGCPRRHLEVGILKNYPFVDTVATLYGKEVHKVAEDYIGDGISIPEKHVKFRPTFEKIAAIQGEKFCEIKLAATRELKKCGFFDSDCWVRGIADLVIISEDGKKAIIIDWKTGGKNYPDDKQLELMFILLNINFPNVETFDCYLVFLAHGVRVNRNYTFDMASACWKDWKDEVSKLELAYKNEHFPPNKTPLCGWCPVATCEFNPAFKKVTK